MSADRTEPKDAPAAAREVFAGYLEALGTQSEVDFEELCASHADSAEELRHLRARWDGLTEVFQRLAYSGFSPGRILARQRTRGHTALEDSGSLGDARFLEETLLRLRERGEAYRRYRVQGEVARGGMGVILRVWDEDLRRDLAMKVVLEDEPGEKDLSSKEHRARLLARFLEEAQVTGQLDHPGIVPVHDLGIDEQGRVYFTMRMVEGRDLERIFEMARNGEEGWSPTRAVGVVLKVCEAMAYAHSKGVVHRDLKPANVMVGRFGEVYVMDWGLARVVVAFEEDTRARRRPTTDTTQLIHTDVRDALDSSAGSPWMTMAGDVVGTPAYMSPEQSRGELGSVGPSSDVYSTGAILYHLLAGHAPYLDPEALTDLATAWERMRSGPPDELHLVAPQAPSELCAICEKAMRREPDQRYASMRELAEDLRAYLEGRVVTAYETGALAEARKWIVRNKALATTVAAALLLILVGTSGASIVLARKNKQLEIASDESRASEVRARESEQLALRNEEEARANFELATEREASVMRLSDVKHLEELREEAGRLWPAYPEKVPAYEKWLAQAGELATRLALHESRLAEIRGQAASIPLVDPDTGEPEGDWDFATTEQRWQHDTLEELVEGLRRFANLEYGLMSDVERRLAFARTIRERSLTGAEAARSWEEAIASIADRDLNPIYGGLALTPQIGLLPIGRDPDSGLWEFAHLQSGAPAERDSRTGELRYGEGSGLVLVLIPGGGFRMGAQAEDPGAALFDPAALPNEAPTHEATLVPFFLSKFEMTQGQWIGASDSNPSIYGPDSDLVADDRPLLHPVEQVSWHECRDVLERMGLVLPSEAQWEYAARAGTGTAWWTGDRKESLEGAANLADRTADEYGVTWPSIAEWPELEDGYVVHAPVGRFRANPFGLHDVHGNVWEWCRDGFGSYEDELRGGDAVRHAPEAKYRASRGGGFLHSVGHTRCARRNNSPPETRANHLGLRPSRRIDP